MSSQQHVVDSFARAAGRYDEHAQVQLLCASRLADYIDANSRDLAAGPILEVGCGTGLVTTRLCDLFPERDIIASDLCEEMLARCRMRVENSGDARSRLTYKLIDACSPAPFSAAAVVAAFTLQWVDNIEVALNNLCSMLVNGGKLFFSVPAAGSFPEWKNACTKAGVTCTANALPSAADFRRFAGATGSVRLSLYEETFPVGHASFAHFLFSLKSIGAGTTLNNARLSASEMRRLLKVAARLYPGSFTATYKVMFGHLTRND